ncbi:cysteine proteinase [Xylariaceae sp. FL0662B]|nr:cysteine proteinase [Xylariaceae sp. FL0662B]
MGTSWKHKGRMNNLGGPHPINQLNRGNQSFPRLVSSSPVHPRSSPPPTKRQRVEDNTHTHAQFVPLVQPAEDTGPITSRKRSYDSINDSLHTLNSQPSGVKAAQTQVPEFRGVDKYTRSHPEKRRRRKSNDIQKEQQGKTAGNGEACADTKGADIGEEDVKLVDSKTLAVSQGRQTAQSQQVYPVQLFGDRFRQNGNSRVQLTPPGKSLKSGIDDTVKMKKQKRKDLSPDELALSEGETGSRMPPKRHVDISPSISRKGDIEPTKFLSSAPSRSQGSKKMADTSSKGRGIEIIGSGLHIARAVSGPYKYDANRVDSAGRCVLRSRDISTILHPTNQNGEILKEYTYLTINWRKISRVEYSSTSDSHIVSIIRSSELKLGILPKLMVAFPSSEELERCLRWINDTRESTVPPKPKEIPGERLEKIFTHLMGEATWSTAVTDNDPIPRDVGADIKLITHNRETRTQERKANARPDTSHTRLKTKDSMRGAPVTTPHQHDDVSTLPDNTQEHNMERPSRTTRSTLTRKSPSPEPEPPGWTVSNEGWENKWRNSLVFPTRGKSRATVEKIDIPRLDEGKFLNDNLISFYLRYLQHLLEENRPDLAQRIYFQNTFFYEKLKPRKAGQGINYDSVKAWTSKVDLFTKDFIIVPINENDHWYVAVVYNAPKLLPSPDGTEKADVRPKDTITIEDADESQGALRASPQRANANDPINIKAVVSTAPNDVINHLSPVNQEKQKSPGVHPAGHENATHLIEAPGDSKAEVEQIAPLSDSLGRKKAVKRQSAGARKHDPDQPKIITLDSLEWTHSPACSLLRQYLVAELKDKKGIEIPSPGSLGMTAKNLPQQSNYCDCGLYLLGYIRELLQNPDRFVRSILMGKDGIDWNLDPSELRNDIRTLLFDLQREQQDREDALKKIGKRKATTSRKNKTAKEDRRLSQPIASPTQKSPTEHSTAKTKEEKVIGNEASTNITIPRPAMVSMQESRQSPSLAEMQKIPGSFPNSPTPDNGGVTSHYFTHGSGAKGDDSPHFLAPLPESSPSHPGSSREKSLPIRDSETTHRKKQEACGNHTGSKEAKSPIAVMIPSLQSHKSLQGPGVEHDTRKGESTENNYHKRRQRGDKMVAATLREEPPPRHQVIDISD